MKRLALGLFFLLASMLPATAACNAVMPFILQPGTLADANQVMANFNAVITGLNNTCAASGINNDITALNAVAVLKPQNNLSDVLNKQTSLNNLGIGCPVGNGPNVATKGSVIGVFATCFGVVADGVTDDTAAWNAALTYSNAHTGTSIIAPPGNSLITTLNAITAANTLIVCLQGMQCTITHSGNNAITWQNVAGGGMYNMRLNNSGAACNVTMLFKGLSISQVFDNMVLGSSIGTFATLGAATSADSVGQQIFTNLTTPQGVNAASPCPVFNFVNGGAFILANSVVQASNFSPVAGRNLMNFNMDGSTGAGTGKWDGLTVENNTLGPFYDVFQGTFASNGLFLDNTFQNNFIINCNHSCFNLSGTGTASTIIIQNNWMDGNNSSPTCVQFLNSNITLLKIEGNRIGECTNNGIALSNNSVVQGTSIMNNLVFDMGAGVGNTFGIFIAGDAVNGLVHDIKIQNNQVTPVLTVGGNIPTIGIEITSNTGSGGAGLNNLLVTGNISHGSSVGCFFGPTVGTSGVIIKDNIGCTQQFNSVAVMPTFQTFAASSGTYTTPVGATWIRVRGIGGGAGGQGSGTSGGAGGNGGSTSFASLMIAGGGSQNLGGTCTSTAGVRMFQVAGGAGGGTSGAANATGGDSGMGYLGGGGGVAFAGTPGNAGAVGTGAGGSGAGSAATLPPGIGGGAGCYIELLITNPAATYTFAVGSGGTAGTAGTGGFAGGVGGDGLLTVEEHYGQ